MADINTGEILEALNEKMDRNANNITKPYLPVFLVATQRPTAENNYTWYRLYSDGWVEQGGYYDRGSFGTLWNTTITMPLEMSITNYHIIVSGHYMNDDRYGEFGLQTEERTTKTFKVYFYTGASADGIRAFFWEVKGYAG